MTLLIELIQWAMSLGISGSAFENLWKQGLFSGEGSLASSLVGYNCLVLPYFLALAEDIGAGGSIGGNFTVAHNQAKELNEGWSWGVLTFGAAGQSFTQKWDASVTVDIALSPQAAHVKDLEGNFVESGFSFNTPPGYLGINSLGFHASEGLGPNNRLNGIYLYTFSFGWGWGSPIEAHAFIGKTQLWKYWEYKP